MNAAHWTSLYQRGRISLLIIAAAFLGLVQFTWLKYGDLIIDTGRELYVPAKLAAGSVLYKDIFYLYGPFSPYFNALFIRIFGADIISLIISGIFTCALTTVLVYKLSRTFLNVLAATFTTLTFLVVLAFGHYVYLGNYNFILPYTYAATHAVLLALSAIYFLFRFLDHQRTKHLLLAGISLGLCLLTRIEIGIMLAAAIALAAVHLKTSGARLRFLISAVLFPLVIAGAVYLVFACASGNRLQNSNMLDLLRSNTNTANPFTASLAGADAPLSNLWLMLCSIFCHIVLLIWIWGGTWVIGQAGRIKTPWARRAIYALASLVIGGGILVFVQLVFNYQSQYRALPLIFLAAIFLGRDIKLTVLSLFALLIAGRMLLNMHPWHYGFFILVPGLIVYHVFLFKTLPQRMGRTCAACPTYHLALTLLLSVFLVRYALVSKTYYDYRTFAAVADRGTLRMLNTVRDRRCAQIVNFLQDQTAKDATVVIFPEGLTINFMAARDNPLYYYTYLPQDLVNNSVNEQIIKEMDAKKIDYVVLLARPLEEYGKTAFGQDYGQTIWNYVLDNYTPHASLGPPPYTPASNGAFGAVIFKRK